MMKRIYVIVFCVLIMAACAGGPATARDSHSGKVEKAPPLTRRQLSPDEQKQLAYQLRAAREFASHKYWDAAVIACHEAIKIDPVCVEAYDTLCKVLVSMGNWAYTIKTLQNLVRVGNTNPLWAKLLVQVCEAYDMPIQEVGALQALVKLEPKNWQAYERMAALYDRMEMPTDIVRALEQAALIEPNSQSVLRKLALAYQGAGMLEKSIATQERLVKLDPKNEEYLALLARLYSDSDVPLRGLAAYRELLKQHPGDADYERQLPIVALNIGNMYFDSGMYTRALPYYKMAQDGHLDDDRLPMQIRKANKLLNPSFVPQWTHGRTGTNNYDFWDATVAVPLRTSEWTLRLMQSRRYVADPTQHTAASTDLTRLSAEARIWKDWRVTGMVGTSNHGMVGSLLGSYQTDRMELDFGYRRDFVYETPLSISSGLAYHEGFADVSYQLLPRVNLGVELVYNQFSNSNNAFGANEILGYSLWQKKGTYNLTLRYIRSDLWNKFEENPLLRFGPKYFSSDNASLFWEHSISKNLHYELEGTRSWDNTGNKVNSYRGRFDWQLGTGTSIFAQYEHGSAPRGAINPNSFNGNADFQTTVGAQITF